MPVMDDGGKFTRTLAYFDDLPFSGAQKKIRATDLRRITRTMEAHCRT